MKARPLAPEDAAAGVWWQYGQRLYQRHPGMEYDEVKETCGRIARAAFLAGVRFAERRERRKR